MRQTFSVAVILWTLAVPPAARGWDTESVDGGAGVGPYSSIKVAPTDEIHIAYFVGSQGIMKYAHFDGADWTTEVVDDQFLTGHHTSIDLDSAGRPHIAYRFYSGHNVRYAVKDAGAWSFSNFETDPDMETDISMALDADDQPHVSYQDGYFQGEVHDLKYAHFDGASWTTTSVDTPGNVGRGSSIAVDSGRHPHISYYDETNVRLKYAHFDGTQWTTTQIDDVEFIGFNFRTAIAVDSHDHPHIVASAYHYENGNWYGRLRYAFFDGAQWHVSTIEQAAANRDLRIPAIVIDRADRPHVSYLLYYNVEPITGDLKYARFDGTVWQIEFIDTGDIADSDFSNGIDLDVHGRPHVSYSRNQSILIHATGAVPAGMEAVSDGGVPHPARLILEPPAPQPADGRVTLSFDLPGDGAIDLGLFDVRGRRIRDLSRTWFPQGPHAVEAPLPLPAGVYFVRLVQGDLSAARRLVIR